MPRNRQPDLIEVSGSGGRFDRFASLVVNNDITGPTEAVFELGDDTSWNELEQVIFPGSDFAVNLNGRPRMKGRAEVNEMPISADGGTVILLTCRTKMSDARYRSAPASVRVKDRTVKRVILDAYAPLGFTEADFVFAPFTARDLMTGERQGGGPVLNLEPIETDQAKVQVPETIYDFVERHLKRYHATHWDAPDGRIVVGVPDDTQAPIYRFIQKRAPNGGQNNVIACKPIRDWTDVARTVTVYGHTVGRDVTSSSFKATQTDPDVDAVAEATGHFNRIAIVSASQAKTQEHAESIALRELSARVRRKQAWEITVDGWSYWDGRRQIPYANNTTADVDIDRAQRLKGRYLVVKVELTYSEGAGRIARLTLVAPGIWVL